MRDSLGMGVDSDEGVAVAALVDEGELEDQRRPAVALGDHAAAGREDGGHQRGQLRSPFLRVTVWRVEEDEIVGGAAGACVAQYPARIVLYHLRVQPQRAEVRADRRDGGV